MCAFTRERVRNGAHCHDYEEIPAPSDSYQIYNNLQIESTIRVLLACYCFITVWCYVQSDIFETVQCCTPCASAAIVNVLQRGRANVA